MRNILWLVGGAAALYFLSRFSFGQKANFVLRGLRPGGTIFAPTINVDFAVQNPTNQTVTIKSVTGSVSVNGEYLANVSAFGDQVIAPNSESMLRLTARPSAMGLFNSIRELLTSPAGQVNASFTGSANVDGLVVPIAETKVI